VFLDHHLVTISGIRRGQVQPVSLPWLHPAGKENPKLSDTGNQAS
jgi:hypothetical protein